MILLDSGGLYTALVESDRGHRRARKALEADPGPLVISPVTLCELDHLLLTRIGVAAEAALLEQIADGAYELAAVDAADIGAARAVIEQYGDLRIGLADASLVVLAGRYETNRVLTFDERHFRALRTPSGEPFAILPADAC
jgi:predicted nucleic acid-binding protein